MSAWTREEHARLSPPDDCLRCLAVLGDDNRPRVGGCESCDGESQCSRCEEWLPDDALRDNVCRACADEAEDERADRECDARRDAEVEP